MPFLIALFIVGLGVFWTNSLLFLIAGCVAAFGAVLIHGMNVLKDIHDRKEKDFAQWKAAIDSLNDDEREEQFEKIKYFHSLDENLFHRELDYLRSF